MKENFSKKGLSLGRKEKFGCDLSFLLSFCLHTFLHTFEKSRKRAGNKKCPELL